jgi:hypothetical protein
MNYRIKKILNLMILFTFILSCTNEDSVNFNNSSSINPNAITTSEGAISSLSGIVGSISNDIQVASLKKNKYQIPFFQDILNPLMGNQEAYAQNNLCPSAYADTNGLGTNPLSCDDDTNSIIDFFYSQCQAGPTSNAILNGDVNFYFPNQDCTTVPLISGSVTFTRIHQPGTYRLSGTGATLFFDSSTPSGYTSSVSGGANLNVGSSNGDPNNLIVNVAITLLGLNIKGVGQNSKPIWDHTITSTALTLAINSGTKTISSGTITVQENLSNYTGTAVISVALVWTAPCNFPTQGTITTTLSGSQSGTEILVFQPDCGYAKLTKKGTTTRIPINDIY